MILSQSFNSFGPIYYPVWRYSLVHWFIWDMTDESKVQNPDLSIGYEYNKKSKTSEEYVEENPYVSGKRRRVKY